MRVTCERCLRRYDVPDATVKGRKIRARCKCGARVVVQDEERAARSSAGGSQTTGSIQRPVRWFVDITSWEPIAMDLRQLVRAFDGGRIDADTLVWRKGMPDWRRLRDVPELAERLMGAEAAAKAAASEAPLEAASGESNPSPPRQVERSRTPPANYSVDDRSPGERVSADDRFSAAPAERVELGAVPPGSEAAATLPGVSAVPQTPAGGYMSPTPPRTRAPSDRRSVPAAAPSLDYVSSGSSFSASPASASSASVSLTQAISASLVGGAQSGSTQMGLASAFAPAGQPRTITQTGLAPAVDPLSRASNAPGANGSATQVSAGNPAGEARLSEPEVVRANPVGGAAAQRNSRSPTPGPGPRRVPSSDETPAQKPSSISVSSGSLMESPPGLRGKHLVAIAVLLLGVAFMVRGTLSTDSGESAPAAAPEHHALPPVLPAEPEHIENRNALAPEPPAGPVQLPPAVAPSSAPTAPAVAAHPAPLSAQGVPAQGATAQGAAEPTPAANPQRVARLPAPSALASATSPRVTKPASLVTPPPSASSPILDVRPSPAEPAPKSEPAPKGEPAPITGRGELAAPATPLPAPPPEPAAPPPVAASPAPAAPAPGLFDERRAREQLGFAAFKASTCGQLGDTRGAGQVNVMIESWGRVVRVTHLNQAFVGTPVGLCIMQAFQTVQVPPFQGGARSLTGSFLIQ
ncbi:MAG: GYF domain-containing protein [Deltaproteobacteria bacterium]